MAAKSILDDVVIAPVALMPALPADYGPAPSTMRIIPTPTGRKLQLNAPFFAKGLSASQMGSNWTVVCGILRAKGLPIYATVQELQTVPAAQVPARIAQRFIGQPLVHDEVTLSDAFELANCTRNGSGWSWPYEISSGRDLKTLVSALRAATSGEVPIGMSLPLIAKPADVRMCLDSSVDYITLTHCVESLAAGSEEIATQAALGVVSARKLCSQFGRPKIPLLLDAPIANGEYMIKLLALGASAINVASLVRNAMPAHEPKRYESMLTENLLGSLPSAQKVVRELPQVERALAELVQKLREVMRFSGLLDISELDYNFLQSLNTGVAEQLGLTALSHRTN